MNNTRTQIINIATDLMRTVGYNAFSYTDISGKLKIKNAAIHYYFPTKQDLGAEVIKRNRSAFIQLTESWKELDFPKQFESYLSMHNWFIENGRVSIIGSLSPVFETLPETMKYKLREYIETVINWLEELLTKGKESGDFTFTGTPRAKAYVIYSAMQSALSINKISGNEATLLIIDSLSKI